MTILATTISIVLTFGTAGLLERCQRVEDRKMSAMMVMSNIEQFSRQIDTLAVDMAKRDSIAAWMLSIPVEQLDDIPVDDIKAPLYELIALDFLSHDKTAENIFSNSIETWKNLGNFQFIDNVGQSFSEMNDIEQHWNDWVNEYTSAINEVQNQMQPGEHTHVKFLSDNRIRQMIEYFHARQYWLEYASAYCRNLNKKNMKLINITENEVMEFTDKRNTKINIEEKEPTQADFRTAPLKVDSLTTLGPIKQHIDSILTGKIAPK